MGTPFNLLCSSSVFICFPQNEWLNYSGYIFFWKLIFVFSFVKVCVTYYLCSHFNIQGLNSGDNCWDTSSDSAQFKLLMYVIDTCIRLVYRVEIWIITFKTDEEKQTITGKQTKNLLTACIWSVLNDSTAYIFSFLLKCQGVCSKMYAFLLIPKKTSVVYFWNSLTI